MSSSTHPTDSSHSFGEKKNTTDSPSTRKIKINRLPETKQVFKVIPSPQLIRKKSFRKQQETRLAEPAKVVSNSEQQISEKIQVLKKQHEEELLSNPPIIQKSPKELLLEKLKLAEAYLTFLKPNEIESIENTLTDLSEKLLFRSLLELNCKKLVETPISK